MKKKFQIPYYGGSEDGFKYCYDLLDDACNRIQKSSKLMETENPYGTLFLIPHPWEKILL